MESVEHGSHTLKNYVYYHGNSSTLKARLQWKKYFRGLRVKICKQKEGNFAERLTRVSTEVFAHNDLLVFWRSNAAYLPKGVFETAFALYPRTVFVPERGGGVAFFSLARENFTPALFSKILWNTPLAARSFRENFLQNGIQIVERARVAYLNTLKNVPRIIRELEDVGDTKSLEALDKIVLENS
ncbi:MAG: hypothetical protein LDLANPLL_02626 [Turneriella sp.]|nr:hypothetical protein [Turneriella sp.]